NGLVIVSESSKGDLKVHVSEIDAMEALGYMQTFGVRVTGHIEPAPIVKTNCFDDQRIFLPVADGISPPGWIRVFGQFAAIKVDLPIIVPHLCIKEQRHHSWG